jgi:hypothetical protein
VCIGLLVSKVARSVGKVVSIVARSIGKLSQ